MKRNISLEKLCFHLPSILNNHLWASWSSLSMLVYKAQYLKILTMTTNKLFPTFKKKIQMTKIQTRTIKIKNTISIQIKSQTKIITITKISKTNMEIKWAKEWWRKMKRKTRMKCLTAKWWTMSQAYLQMEIKWALLIHKWIPIIEYSIMIDLITLLNSLCLMIQLQEK